MKKKKNRKWLVVWFFCFITGCILMTTHSVQAKEQETIRVGYVESVNFMEGMGDEEYKSGYAYEYLQNIAYYSGWNYEYVYGDWGTIFGMLQNGEIDLMAGISYTTERAGQMNFPDMPMGVENYYIYVRDERTEAVDSVEDLAGLRIGYIADSMQETSLREWNRKNGERCQEVGFAGSDALYQALSAHEVDAVVDTDNAISPSDGLFPVVKIGSSEYYLAVAKQRGDLLEELNRVLSLIDSQNPSFTSELHKEYFSETAIRTVLTEEEKEWLKQHSVITIGYVEDYAPFCLTKEGEGAHGMMIDVIQYIWEYLDLSSEKQYSSFSTYEELSTALQQGEVDIVLPVYENAWYSEQDELLETTAITSFAVDMIYGENYLSSKEDVIAIAMNSPIQSKYVSLYFADNPRFVCRTQKECVEAVQNGSAKAMLVSSYSAGTLLRNNSNLKVMQLSDGASLCMGTRKEDIQLLSILNRGLLGIGEKRITDSLQRHTDEAYTISLSTYISENWFSFFLMLLGIFLVLMGGAVMVIITTNKSKARLIKNEKKMMEQLDILHSMSGIYTYMNLLDFQNQTVIRFDADELRVVSYLMADDKRTQKNQEMAEQIVAEQRERFLEFTDLSTLHRRLKDKKVISDEFIDCKTGWIRAQYIAVDGNASKVIYTIQNIEEEKQKEEQLIRISYTDELTRLPNRKAYEDDLRQWQHASLPKDFVYISMDVNGLKLVNDTMGHAAGDELLRGAAECMRKCFGSYGKVYRIGGDEFSAILFVDENRIAQINTLFKQEIAAWEGERVKELSVSIGYATQNAFPESSVLEMADAADKQMYRSKSMYYVSKGIDRRTH